MNKLKVFRIGLPYDAVYLLSCFVRCVRCRFYRLSRGQPGSATVYGHTVSRVLNNTKRSPQTLVWLLTTLINAFFFFLNDSSVDPPSSFPRQDSLCGLYESPSIALTHLDIRFSRLVVALHNRPPPPDLTCPSVSIVNRLG